MRHERILLTHCGFVERNGPAVILRMNVEAAEDLGHELHRLAYDRGGVVRDVGWKQMSEALLRVTAPDDADAAVSGSETP